MNQADWEPVSASWSQPAWSSAPLEHTVHHQNLTNWPSNFQSAVSTWPVYFWVALLFLHIPDGALPSNCCTLEQTILRPMKQSSPALSTRTIDLMPFLAIFENVSGYSLHWKNKNKQNKNLHANDSKNRCMWLFKVITHKYFTTKSTVLRKIQYLNIIFSYILVM